MSIAQALTTSCDTVFYPFGSDFFNYWRDNQLGEDGELMQELFREWGFERADRRSTFPLRASGSSRMPSGRSEDEIGRFLFPDGWVPGGNILSMIGSAYLMATPLQLARAYMAIANRGHMCEPHVADGDRERPQGGPRSVQTAHATGASPGTPSPSSRYIHQALLGVTSGGTAACAFNGFPLAEIPVAGKTGTAESDLRSRTRRGSRRSSDRWTIPST